MPDGEIFTGPVEQSVNGWVRFEFRAYHGTKCRASTALPRRPRPGRRPRRTTPSCSDAEADAGARFWEFAIGNNFGVQRITREILFDEKFGGTIHLALGAGYPDTGSVNKSSIHWDMICDVRRSEITVDGTLFYKDGAFG
jgi:aminopeptidase